MSDTHQHDCETCGDPFDCSGYWSRNYDGFPEAVCSQFHEGGYQDCESCHDTPRCEWCGIPCGTAGLETASREMVCDLECAILSERGDHVACMAGAQKYAAWQASKKAKRDATRPKPKHTSSVYVTADEIPI